MENLEEFRGNEKEMKIRIQTFDKVYHFIVLREESVLGLKNIINSVFLLIKRNSIFLLISKD